MHGKTKTIGFISFRRRYLKSKPKKKEARKKMNSEKNNSLPFKRDAAWELVKEYNKDQSDLNHYLESEAIMLALAKRLGEDEETWGMLGLMHDIDWGITKSNPKDHLTKASDILRKAGFSEDFIEIIVSHGYGYECAGLENKKRTTKAEHALACAETVTGLIHAYALIRGSIKGMEVKGLKKKFKEKSFAAAINREIINECGDLGIELSEFLQLSIDAVAGIADKVDLI